MVLEGDDQSALHGVKGAQGIVFADYHGIEVIILFDLSLEIIDTLLGIRMGDDTFSPFLIRTDKTDIDDKSFEHALNGANLFFYLDLAIFTAAKRFDLELFGNETNNLANSTHFDKIIKFIKDKK